MPGPKPLCADAVAEGSSAIQSAESPAASFTLSVRTPCGFVSATLLTTPLVGDHTFERYHRVEVIDGRLGVMCHELPGTTRHTVNKPRYADLRFIPNPVPPPPWNVKIQEGSSLRLAPAKALISASMANDNGICRISLDLMDIRVVSTAKPHTVFVVQYGVITYICVLKHRGWGVAAADFRD